MKPLTLKDYMTIQKDLQKAVMKEHPQSDRHVLEHSMMVALKTELGEAANEWRGFKIWSHDQAPRTQMLLEEMSDVWHFILIMGLVRNYEFVAERVDDMRYFVSEREINPLNAFTDLFENNCQSAGIWLRMIHDFISLFCTLGFTLDDLENAYLSKNEVNYKRVQSGY